MKILCFAWAENPQPKKAKRICSCLLFCVKLKVHLGNL